jgi:hypothetical protein
MGGHRTKRQKLNVVKVPGNYNFEFRAPNWADMPILYLELLENKAKVKPEYRNIDYEPSGYDMNSFPNFAQARISAVEETRRDIENNEEYNPNSVLPSIQSYNPQPIQQHIPPPVQPVQHYQQQVQNMYTPPRVNTPKVQTPSKFIIHQDEQSLSSIYNAGTVSLSAALSNNPPPPVIHPPQPQQSQQPQQSTIVSNDNSLNDHYYDEECSKSVKESSEDNSILNILRGENSNVEEKSPYEISMSSIPQVNYIYPPSPKTQQIPQTHQTQQTQQKLYPSLSEINSGQTRPGNRDLTFLNKNDEKDLQRKRELLFKFKTLKRHYTDANVPEFTEYSDLQTMEREYDTLVRQLRIDSNVENYKKYLIVGFGLVEFVLSKFLKFTDIEGFTQQQLLGMNQYEKILLEIGEKHQIEPSKQWSPELRLVGIVAMNAVIFVGTKMLFKSASGGDILNMISSPAPKATTTAPPKTQSSASTSNQQTNNKKMKGPDMDLDNL